MRSLRSRRLGATISELVISLSIASAMAGGLLVGALSIQKSFQASRHHVNAQSQQLRLMDYINLDLRRALTVNTANGRLTVSIPDYYDANGQPRDPQIVKSLAVYGSAPRTIAYFKEGSTIYRSEGGKSTALATEVLDFKLLFQDLGQSIMVSVTFLPKFQLSGKDQESVRNATATFSTTLLRNKRQK
jgi:hypothetical protein